MAQPLGDADRPPTATSAIPAFLDSDPYPPRQAGARPGSTGSVITDTTSEFGGGAAAARDRYSGVPSITGPVGEPGLPPSRPMSSEASAVSSLRTATKPAPTPPGTRKGLATYAPRSSNSSRGGAGVGGDAADASAPGAPPGRTHVPSLAAQNFFQPMSSQRLQVQRGQRPPGSPAQGAPPARLSEEGSRRRRNSDASLNTLRDGPPPTQDGDARQLPASRGTMFTQDGTQPERHPASDTSHTSYAPLHGHHGARPPILDLKGLRSQPGVSPRSPKSPRSLRASLGLGPRLTRNGHDRRPSPGQHAQLYSEPSSPNYAEKPLPRLVHAPAPRGAGKNYEYFAGNMLFFLSGSCLNAKARPLNVATFVATVLPAALFFAFSAPWLWHHVSPAIPIIFAYVFCITISSFFHAAFSDPGILPRNLHPHPPNPDEERDPLTLGPPTTEWVMVKTFPSQRSPAAQASPEEAQQSGTTTAMEVPTKYCKSCNIWRPPRAHHCRVCDACIETQDHHCVWLNNCVGRRNYRFFFAFVGFGSVLALMLLAFSLTHVALYGQRHHIGFGGSLSGRTSERVAFAMFIYSIVALPYPGSLFVYHLFLMARGETTREYLNSHKFLPKDRHRPFTQSNWAQNWATVLMRPRPPTYMQFKGHYREGDLRYGHTQTKKERKKASKTSSSATNGANGPQKDGPAKAVEMKQLSPRSHAKSQARSAGHLSGGPTGPLNSTPR